MTDEWIKKLCYIYTVQFSRSVVSNSLRHHELQHARPTCSSPTPGIHSNSCPSSRWCHPAISSSVVPFSSCPQSLPASESFPMSHVYMYSEILFSHKKEQIWVSSNEADEPRTCYTERSKPERDEQISYINAYIRESRRIVLTNLSAEQE